jgi:hypothetical protein
MRVRKPEAGLEPEIRVQFFDVLEAEQLADIPPGPAVPDEVDVHGCHEGEPDAELPPPGDDPLERWP